MTTKILYREPPVYVRWEYYEDSVFLRSAFLTVETSIVDTVDTESEGTDEFELVIEYHIGFYNGGGTLDIRTRFHTYLDYAVNNWGDPDGR